MDGAAHAGVDRLPQHETELGCLVSLIGQAHAGDVVALMTHQDREQVDTWRWSTAPAGTTPTPCGPGAPDVRTLSRRRHITPRTRTEHPQLRVFSAGKGCVLCG